MDDVILTRRRKPVVSLTNAQPLWYKDAIFYELRVRSFCDGNGDGIGDFEGLTQKLDYLQDLGVTTLWLLPFYPSPMKDDGYDIADYTEVDPACGTLQDFKTFLKEAHSRGLQVVTELVLNHTSNQHSWFQRAQRDKPGGAWRDFYVWSDTPEKYRDSRIIFKDFETSNWAWDPVAKAYYWHRFFFHQPDLNFDNPAVRKAMLEVVDFWLGMGVDGLRLDAVPYLIEREGTSCENLLETHDFLKELRTHIDKHFPNRMLLAEANQWPEDAAAYFGKGNECHMAFHFPIMPRLFMALHMEDRFPIIDILEQTPEIDPSCQWAIFLRNHDELTLEMVTEEERDYMYRVYATDPQARINLGIRRRLAPLLGNDRRKMELMNGLLLSLPGTPVIYYGDEIGMGDNIFLGDRNGVRTPMQWSADRNAGFSPVNPQRMILPIVIDPEYHYETFNVDAQQRNPHSILWWMKRLIALRKQSKAFGQGSIQFLTPKNPKVLAFIRQYGDSTILVVANLSRYSQYIELNLERFEGKIPVELFGRTEFPRIGTLPYLLTLGSYAFYWFSIETPADAGALTVAPSKLSEVALEGTWPELLETDERSSIEAFLPSILRSRRWFSGKGRRIKSVKISEFVPISDGPNPVVLLFLNVEYIEGSPETYNLPVVFFKDEETPEDLKTTPAPMIRLRITHEAGTQGGILYDGFYDLRFAQKLLHAISEKEKFKGQRGTVRAVSTSALKQLSSATDPIPPVKIVGGEQSNTSLVYDDKLILKLFRRLEEGVNPDLEIGQFLTEKAAFPNLPPVAGYIEYAPPKGDPTTLAVLHQYVANQGSAWDYALGDIQRYLELALAQKVVPADMLASVGSLPALMAQDVPPLAKELIGNYLAAAKLLGQRTAEMHAALAGQVDASEAFQPEPFNPHYQWGLYQAMRSMAAKTFNMLRERLPQLPEKDRARATRVLELQSKIQARFRLLADRKLSAKRIRTHGDFHLGQVLYTGKDFVIIDFEGEPTRPISARRIKHSPLRDVAGMLRSFHYASQTALSSRTAGPVARPEDRTAIDAWAFFWRQWVSATYLKSYLEAAAPSQLFPATPEAMQILLNAFLLEKALYEISYELSYRPDWVHIPLEGVLQLVEPEPSAPPAPPAPKPS
jgi:maltose alpha-D-glucosyltransferase / alpha-amylase